MYYGGDILNDHSPYETTLPKDLYTPTEFPPLFHVSYFTCNLDEVVTCDDVAENNLGYITVLDGEYF